MMAHAVDQSIEHMHPLKTPTFLSRRHGVVANCQIGAQCSIRFDLFSPFRLDLKHGSLPAQHKWDESKDNLLLSCVISLLYVFLVLGLQLVAKGQSMIILMHVGRWASQPTVSYSRVSGTRSSDKAFSPLAGCLRTNRYTSVSLPCFGVAVKDGKDGSPSSL